MVYSAFYCDEEQLPILNELGCAGRPVLTRANIYQENSFGHVHLHVPEMDHLPRGINDKTS